MRAVDDPSLRNQHTAINYYEDTTISPSMRKVSSSDSISCDSTSDVSIEFRNSNARVETNSLSAVTYEGDEDNCTTRESSVSKARSSSGTDSKFHFERSNRNSCDSYDRIGSKRGRHGHEPSNCDKRRRSRSNSRPKSSHAHDNSSRRRSNDRYRYSFSTLPLEWWDRTDGCKEAKISHTDRLDDICSSREDLILKTTLWREDTVLEPNMFPYLTPKGIEHYTLWSIYDLRHDEIVRFVEGWLRKRFPKVRRWQYDDNSGERSIELFHVHVFIETDPFSFVPQPDALYIPPHMLPPNEDIN